MTRQLPLRSILAIAPLLPLLAGTPSLASETAAGAQDASKQADLDARFAETMTGATLVGRFSDDTRREDGQAATSQEKYTLGEVRKLDGNLWLFQTRIQYGDHDITLPLSLPVEWAGDTPVITLDKLAIPGMGTFSARVLIHDGRYAGYWQGANHGGHLFGTVEKGEADSE